MSFFSQLFTDPIGWYHAHELLVAQAGINGLLALSIWVTLFAGQLTLANVGFMAIGAYTSVILDIHFHLPFVLNILAGGILAAGAAVVIGLPVLRLRGVFLAIATIGFGEVVRFGFILNLGITGRGQGLNNPHASPSFTIVPVWLSILVLTPVLWRLRTTRTGQAWSAIRQDEVAAASTGVATTSYKLAAFVVGAILASYAGALDAHLNFFLDPTEYAFNRAVLVLVFAFVGGVAVPLGPILGAITLTSLPEVMRFARGYRDVVDGAVLMAIAVFRPEGLIGGRWGRARPRRRLPWPHRRAPTADATRAADATKAAKAAGTARTAGTADDPATTPKS